MKPTYQRLLFRFLPFLTLDDTFSSSVLGFWMLLESVLPHRMDMANIWRFVKRLGDAFDKDVNEVIALNDSNG